MTIWKLAIITLSFCIYNSGYSQLITVSAVGTKATGSKELKEQRVERRAEITPMDSIKISSSNATAVNQKEVKFYSPLGNLPLIVTSPFGMRMHPKLGVFKLHNGIDLKANYVPVYAVASGVISASVYDDKAGLYCKINHGDSIQTVYAHLSILFVKKGNWVNGGEVIGISGATGLVTGPHLHFGLKLNVKPPNPLYQY
jgi:murein DD-endopeptidase MepM/ murein hydrolase activator NlpD